MNRAHIPGTPYVLQIYTRTIYTIYTQNIILAYYTSHNQGFPTPELVSVCLVALDEFLLYDRGCVSIDKRAKARGQPRGSTDIPRGTGEPGHSLCMVEC